jgi:hypothetical protein
MKMSIERFRERRAMAATTPTRLSRRVLIRSEFASLTKSLRGWVLEKVSCGLSVKSKEAEEEELK